MDDIQEHSSVTLSQQLLAMVDLQSHISGNYKIIVAIDRLCCPLPGAMGATLMKESLVAISEWSKSLQHQDRIKLAEIIGSHLKKAISEINSEKQAQQSDQA